MSNKEAKNQVETNKEAGVEKRRLFIKGAGVVAPVVLTLSSPSVFGESCRSEIVSGNQSNSNSTGSCVLGENRKYWKNPLNKDQWPNGYIFGEGTSTTSCNNSNYSGGTTFRAVFGGSSPNQPMRKILCAGTLPESYYVAAILSAYKYPNYVLRPAEVIELYKNHAPIPTGNLPLGYPSVEAFIASTLKTLP